MILSIAAALSPSPVDFDVRTGEGMVVSMHGVPVVQGSWFQYFGPRFSSRANPMQLNRVDENTVRVSYEGTDGPVRGTQTYTRRGNEIQVHYRFEHEGDQPAKVELAGAMLFAPALEQGSLRVDGKETRPLDRFAYSGSGLDERRFGDGDARQFVFDAPLGRVEIESSRPLTLFDARAGWPGDWAEGQKRLWLGSLGLPVAKGQPAELTVTYRFVPNAVREAAPISKTLQSTATNAAVVPVPRRPILVPKPKTVQLDWERTLPISGQWAFPAGKTSHFSDFQSGLERRFILPRGGTKVNFDAGQADLGLKPGGYRIRITEKEVSVIGERRSENDEGIRNGLRRLAQLAFVKDGKLVFPTGTLIDQPTNLWRGVHLFVGPTAVGFHRDLWERVLLPMHVNQAVLQVERTDWKSLPGTKGAITMSREDLATLFQVYRNRGVDPVPLIQSFGHMEWIFANGQNLEAAFNREVPYSIDPRKPRSRELLTNVWNEAISLLRPTRVHFGLDEVDMRGWPDDPQLVTELWQMHLPFLADIAKRHNVGMMLWGDNALAPGEGPDATHGTSKEHAAARRSAIPKGTWITDWHYKADPDPQTFVPVLQLWKREGFHPIASTWYRPENIRGFTLAANIENAGILQTTWAGYESSESNMLRELKQFSAMILMADYAWSGRTDGLAHLGYDPMEVFREMYFGKPAVVVATTGSHYTNGRERTIDGIRFRTDEPMRLQSVLMPPEGTASRLDLRVGGVAREIALAVDTAVATPDGEAVADVVVEFANGKQVIRTLRYGYDVRAGDDSGTTWLAGREDGLSAVRIDLGGSQNVRSVKVTPQSNYAGLRVHGITAW